ncbi:DUF397 domain-containing protein [Streptomyces sp. BI20]|uniref:DUF397 domain-containing protein n=1 Tax=Streptomyces sp. BI20 TaxID=3403460 RepID=UPI003C754595
MTTDFRWFKSSHSQDGGACIEVSVDLIPAGLIPVRDSKVAGGPVLRVAAPAFAAFVAGVRGGRAV